MRSSAPSYTASRTTNSAASSWPPDCAIPFSTSRSASGEACRQKNAAAFLAGDVQTSVMAHYAPGLFSTKQKLHSRHPAPDEDTAAVLELVEWREDAPYG